MAEEAGHLADLSACPGRVPRPKFDVAVPNEVYQADLLFLPHDRIGRKTLRYAFMVVDKASRYKEAEPLTSKTAVEVADGLARINKRSPLRWPKLLQVDPGREFMDVVSQLFAKHGVEVRRGRVDIHRDQGVVERLNWTLTERLFGYQCPQEMRLPSGQRSTEWVARLPIVLAALSGDQVDWQKALRRHQSQNREVLLCSSRPPCWFQGAEAPLGSWVSLPLPARRAGGRSAPRD